MRAALNNESIATAPPFLNVQQPKPLEGGGLNAFYWYQIFALDSMLLKHKINRPTPGSRKLQQYQVNTEFH